MTAFISPTFFKFDINSVFTKRFGKYFCLFLGCFRILSPTVLFRVRSHPDKLVLFLSCLCCLGNVVFFNMQFSFLNCIV